MRLCSIIIGVLAVSLLIFSCSAVTLTVQNGHVDNPGGLAMINITLDSAPEGLAGYIITVSVIDPEVATLESVTFPDWAIVNDNSDLPSSTCNIAGADIRGTITPGSTNVTFASFMVEGLQAGSTDITVGITEIDDFEGNPFVPAIQQGTFTVGGNFTINATAGPGGMISPSGLVIVLQGANQTFTMTPDLGYGIADVEVDNVSEGSVGSVTFTNVQADHTISVTFSQVNYSINATAGNGGSISPSGMVSVPAGADQMFNITPLAGFGIADVMVDSESVGAVDNVTFTNVHEDHTIEATFSSVQANYTVTASAGGGGSINPSGMVNVPEGADQSFTIAANTGYAINDVLVDSVSVGAVGSYTFTNVTEDHTISATFSQVPGNFTINATAGAGGIISPSGDVSVPEGADQTFTIAANTGYAINDVLVDSVSVGAVGSYTFTNVTADHTISATFSQVPVNFTINANAGTGGIISPSGDVSVPEGADQTFTIAANTGYAINDVLVDSVSVGAVGSYTFADVQTNHTIEVSFSLSPTNKATLYVASYPTGATILLDELNVGKTNGFVYHAPSGVHNLTLEKTGYISKTLLVTIPSDGLKVLEPITLQPGEGPAGSGTLYVASVPSNATILIDGVVSGTTNRFVYGVQSGTRNLTLTKTGFQPKTVLVQIPAGGLKVLAPINLAPL